jgi:membrane associated rhomboid family serine protease
MAEDLPTAEVVSRTPVERVAQEQALVLRAVGVPCAVQYGPDGFELIVSGADADRARAELAAYAAENPADASAPVSWMDRTDGWLAALGYGIVLLAVAIAADRSLWGRNWFLLGKANAGLISAGEWWRTITALTLHADRAHLLANLVIGGLFGIFAARLFGSGLAWLGILLGGALGNAANALLRPESHSAVGASTAIFAALGLVAAWAWTQRREHPLRRFARWTPLVGAVALLGLLGGGGEDGGNVDVGAHILGLLCGGALGAAWGKLGPAAPLSARAQVAMAVACVALIALAWGLAWRVER